MKSNAFSIDITVKRNLGCTFSRARIKKVLEQVLESEKVTGPLSVDVLVTNDRQIHKMNKQYRGIDSPTDVLSFALNESIIGTPDTDFPCEPDGVNNLGQIIISYPRVVEQAIEYESTAEEEMVRLLTHGCLHLLGYDHTDNANARKMRRRERSIISKIQKSGNKG